jgi:hypothetical protein
MPCRWFRLPNSGRIEDCSALAGVGWYGVGQPNRWPYRAVIVFESLCQSVHEKLVFGKCPWCGHFIAFGSDVLETQDFKITDFREDVLDKEGAISHLHACLKHTNAGLRALAAKYLGEFGPDAKDALPDLTLLLQDKEPLVRDAAAVAIKNIEKER